jgi:hypothetical protein
MKYPTHTILDVQIRPVLTSNGNWRSAFSRLALPTHPNDFDLLRLSGATRSALGLPSALSKRLNAASTNQPLTFSVFDIHLLRKEKLYTKLKYSRCPQYDIVSGGFAALLAGFIGFLISEKFGIELVDGGDFYNALMYAVFLTFSLRPLLKSYSKDNTYYSPLSPKHLLIFLRDTSVLSIRWTLSAGLLLLQPLQSLLRLVRLCAPTWSRRS